MSIYTKESQNIYFLNDKNIASSMNDTTVLSNSVPSFDIVSAAYDEFEELCADVKSNYVKKNGDVMTGNLSIASQLVVDNNVEFKKNLHILNNLTQGKGSYVNSTIDRGIAIGISAVANKNDSFVWNGDYSVETYSVQDDKAGSFNINPVDGTKGFYVGSKNLSDIIHDDVLLTANSITSDMLQISTELCTTADVRRSQDKAELSTVLSTYSNSLCTSISNTVNYSRSQDKAELSTVLSTYSNSLCTLISSCVSSAGYAMYNDYDFTYNNTTHYLSIFLKDQNGRSLGKAIDATEFIKNRIVDHMRIVSPDDPEYGYDPPVGKVLRIYWKNASGDLSWTDIQLSDIAQIYKAGIGININDGLSIEVADYNGIVFCVSQTSANVNILSNATIPALTSKVDSLESYARSLSSTYTDGGIIATLSVDLHSLSDNISADVKHISNDILPTLRTDVDNIAAHTNSLQWYANKLSADFVGDIPQLSGSIDQLRTELRGSANFIKTVKMSKYHPDWLLDGTDSRDSSISTFFKYIICDGVEKPIKNGNIYEVEFKECSDIDPKFVFTEPIFAADQYFDTSDGVRLAHKCFLVVTTPDGAVDIPVRELNAGNVRVLAGEWYKPYQVSVLLAKDTVWCEGNNKISDDSAISVTTANYMPAIVKLSGHAISGDNDFCGTNVFYNDVSVDFGKLHDIGHEYSSTYSTLSTFELSTELSIWTFANTVQSKIREIYNKVSSITTASDPADITQAVVDIAHGLSDLFDIKI